jgi:glycosyltransferase involved in cell wall biosynthesis
VDLDVFAPAEPVEPAVLRRHGLENRFLVGWAGSFRPYHGLGQVEALAQELNRRLPDATLCLLGSGPLRAPLEAVASRHPERVVCLPQVPQAQVPRWLSTFDVCLQLADPGAGDHYSPLKVLEYLGCARPVVAADVVPNGFLTHGTDALLVRPGDVEGVVSALECLHENADARLRLSRNARATARRHGSWRTAAESMWQLAEARHAEGGMPS